MFDGRSWVLYGALLDQGKVRHDHNTDRTDNEHQPLAKSNCIPLGIRYLCSHWSVFETHFWHWWSGPYPHPVKSAAGLLPYMVICSRVGTGRVSGPAYSCGYICTQYMGRSCSHTLWGAAKKVDALKWGLCQRWRPESTFAANNSSTW